ncbi:MAG: BlaI/MecI/CopY family transcriptional regulator [Clostridiales bacterium]|nr:BlaI/MecI/CopY family transcriptional regulator [Clostridiales bacterium]
MNKLTDSEWKIIDLLWKGGPMTLMQITRSTEWSKSTVVTFLKRMEEKEAIYHIDGEKARLYYPSIERSQASLDEAKSFLNRVYEGKIGLMISNLIKEEAISDEELQELSRILKEGE